MTPPHEGSISIRTPDQEVEMVHLRATERLETYGQSHLQRRPTFANALKNIQHTLMPALRPFMNNWTRELSQLTSRQIAKQISNHCNQQQIRESVCQIIRRWANDGASPFPIALGPIDSDLTLFNLSPTKGVTQECVDSTSHRILLGSMSFILSCEQELPLNNVCEIFFQLIDTPIQDPATNIFLAWAAAQLGTWLLVGLCHCSDDNCSCTTQLTKETLLSLKDSKALMYHREQVRNQDQGTVLEQFQISCTCFTRPMVSTPPKPHGGRTRHYQGPPHHQRRPNGYGGLPDPRLPGNSNGPQLHKPPGGPGELEQNRTAIYTWRLNLFLCDAGYARSRPWLRDTDGWDFDCPHLVRR